MGNLSLSDPPAFEKASPSLLIAGDGAIRIQTSKMILTILRTEFLGLTNNRCAAEVLEFFKNQRSGWVKITIAEIREKFQGLYGKDAIAAATRLLDELGVVRRRKQPYNGQDKTWQYKFDKEYLNKQQTWMAQGWCPLPECNESKSAPKVEQSAVKIENPPLKAENQTFSIYIDPSVLDPINFDPPTNPVAGEKSFEQKEELRATIADAPFMRDENLQETSLPAEPRGETKFSAAVARDFLQRLRNLGVPLTEEVRGLVQKTPETQLLRNVSALEEEAQTKGLRSPIAACKHFISNNCQPRDEAKLWFHRAARALGKEQRDHLIQAVTEYAGAVWIFFKNGRQLTLTEVQGMSWEAIALVGGVP